MKNGDIHITKSFGMKINAEYQSYDFGTSMSIDVCEKDLASADDRSNVSQWADWLCKTVIDATILDIKAFAEANDTFRAVLTSRNTKISTLPSDFQIANNSNIKV